MTDLLRLYPGTGERVALNALYLNSWLEPRGFAGPLFVYSDYRSQLGRPYRGRPAR